MNNSIRVVFMGTPDFAVESLKELKNNQINIVGIITAPDKPAGRGKKMQSSAVKQYAVENNILPILQPTNLKDPEFIEELQTLNADLFVVVAFRMLPEVVWSMPKLGTINLHASLLPHYRGAAPINWVIINGEEISGVTTFFIEKEIDTGKVIRQEQVEIEKDENAGDLHDKLMKLGAGVLVETVRNIASGCYESVSQDVLIDKDNLKTAPKIFKEDCRIHWNNKVGKIYNFIRGLSPYPAAWTEISGKDERLLHLKLYIVEMLEEETSEVPGTFIVGKDTIRIACKNGYINILSLQQAGKKRMSTVEFLRGFNEKDNFIKAH